MDDNTSTVRAFFAIELPKSYKELIFNQIILKLSKRMALTQIHWISLENLYITLPFIHSAIRFSEIPAYRWYLPTIRPFYR